MIDVGGILAFALACLPFVVAGAAIGWLVWSMWSSERSRRRRIAAAVQAARDAGISGRPPWRERRS